MMRCGFRSVSVILLVLGTACAEALESGQLIPSGAPDGRGPLASLAVIGEPVGVARISSRHAEPVIPPSDRASCRPEHRTLSAGLSALYLQTSARLDPPTRGTPRPR